MRSNRVVHLARVSSYAVLAAALFHAGSATAQTTPPTTPPAATAPAPEPSADVVVTGTRAAQRRAISAKHDADNIVETLYANDVGKLPDQNVAEAVRRLPGVSVAND